MFFCCEWSKYIRAFKFATYTSGLDSRIPVIVITRRTCFLTDMCQISSGRNQHYDFYLLGVNKTIQKQFQTKSNNKSNPVFEGQEFPCFVCENNKLRINFISLGFHWSRWILTICWTLKRSGGPQHSGEEGSYFVCSPAIVFGGRIRVSSPKQIGMKDCGLLQILNVNHI